MSRRYYVLGKGRFYHVFNRSIARQPIFINKTYNSRAIELINYYRFSDLPLRYSFFNRLEQDKKAELYARLFQNNNLHVKIHAFCLMPNHYHFLLEQITDSGISTFIKNYQIGFSKYFNLRQERAGSLFQEMFKAVPVETDEQFLHVMRYIHLNPLTSLLVDTMENLMTYKWSSLPCYFGNNSFSDLITRQTVLGLIGSETKLKEFIADQASYQQSLEELKHLTFD